MGAMAILVMLLATALPQDVVPLRLSLSEPAPLQGESGTDFLFGVRAGYFRIRGADEGDWFGGVQGRLFFNP